MNLEVFREGDTVWIRDTDTDDEWPLPAEVWTGIHQPIIEEHEPIDGYCGRCSQDEEQPQPVGWWIPWPCPTLRALGFPPVWGPVSAGQVGASARDTPDGRAT